MVGNTQDTVCWCVADIPGKDGSMVLTEQALAISSLQAFMSVHPSRV